MKRMGIRLVLVTIAVITLSYQHFVSTVREQALDSLAKYADERVEREQLLFDLADKNHRQMKQGFLRLLHSIPLKV